MGYKELNTRGLELWKLLMTLRTSKPLMLFVNLEPSKDCGVFEPKRLKKLKPTTCLNLRNKCFGYMYIRQRNIPFIIESAEKKKKKKTNKKKSTLRCYPS